MGMVTLAAEYDGARKRLPYTSVMDTLFEQFWASYPVGRKVGKPAALRAWKRIFIFSNDEGCRVGALLINAGLQKWKRSKEWENRYFIPYPSTFLNQRRWEDSPVPIEPRNDPASREARIGQALRPEDCGVRLSEAWRRRHGL
jgi:hypothetical protein